MDRTPIADKPPLFSIREFFAGKHVLLTGSTGFLAKAVAEKLLFELPEIGQVHLLIRTRRKPNGHEIDPWKRLKDEVLHNSAFNRLRQRHGTEFEAFCAKKLTCVAGDLTKPNLGLEPAAYEKLTAQLDVIINSAATVVFDERLDVALTLNTLGPGRLLDLAKASGSVYVHISTCYVSGKRPGRIEEKLMDPMAAIDAQLPPGAPRPKSFDVREEVRYLQALAEQVKAECAREVAAKKINPKSEEATSRLQTALVSAGMERAQSFGWHDTYTFTKFLGEQLVHMDHGQVPTVIVRPSIIESSLCEPEPGWLDGLRMADPIIIGFGKGRLADFPANPNVVIDIIPADFVVNAILAAAAYIAPSPGGFDLFQVASSSKNPLPFRRLYEHVGDCFRQNPFLDKSGRPVTVPEWRFPSIPQYRRRMKARYLFPARVANMLVTSGLPIPGANKWRARLRSKITTLEQLLYYVDIYGPYVNLDCRFDSGRSLELLEKIVPEERQLFNFDTMQIDWRRYLQDVHIPGLKRNILRMGVLPRAGAGQGHLLDEANERAARNRRTRSEARHEHPQSVNGTSGAIHRDPGSHSSPAHGNRISATPDLSTSRTGPRTAGTSVLSPTLTGSLEQGAPDHGGINGTDHCDLASVLVGKARKRSNVRGLFDRIPAPTETLEKALNPSPALVGLRKSYELICTGLLKSYFRLEWSGTENVQDRGPFILASNHCSHLDSAAIRKALGRRSDNLYVMAAKDYFFDTPFKSWFFRTFLNALPVDREGHTTEGLVICRMVLERNRSVLIYPEGGRSHNGVLQRFKPGIGVLAMELNVPVIPVLVTGTHTIWPKSRRFPKPGPIHVRFGKRVDFSHLKALCGQVTQAELYRRAANELRDQVQSLGPAASIS
jgi:1-acyl-sn-glycerol-3-phosphate acyltransferase